jgi:hypothetical protein
MAFGMKLQLQARAVALPVQDVFVVVTLALG